MLGSRNPCSSSCQPVFNFSHLNLWKRKDLRLAQDEEETTKDQQRIHSTTDSRFIQTKNLNFASISNKI